MDDDLFTSSLKPRKGASSRAAKTSDTSAGSRPASRMSTATSKDAGSPRGLDKQPDTPDSGITGEENDSPKKGMMIDSIFD